MYIYHPTDNTNKVGGGSDTLSHVLGTKIGKRQNNDANSPNVYPVSTMQKTVIPIVIGLVLFAIAFVVFFVIVRKKRIQNKQSERDEQRRKHLDDLDHEHDDDFELSPAYRSSAGPRTQSQYSGPSVVSRPAPAMRGREPPMQQTNSDHVGMQGRREQRAADFV